MKKVVDANLIHTMWEFQILSEDANSSKKDILPHCRMCSMRLLSAGEWKVEGTEQNTQCQHQTPKIKTDTTTNLPDLETFRS